MGRVRCLREFKPVLGGKYVQLICTWRFAKGSYEKIALFSVDDGVLTFWSCTSDGKKSTGVLTNAVDIHSEAISFEAKVPSGVARQIYWPNDAGGFNWAVEAKSKTGWKSFVEHHCTAP